MKLIDVIEGDCREVLGRVPSNSLESGSRLGKRFSASPETGLELTVDTLESYFGKSMLAGRSARMMSVIDNMPISVLPSTTGR